MTAHLASPNTAMPKVALATLGVVFGDIGTSPLSAFNEVFAGAELADAGRRGVVGAGL